MADGYRYPQQSAANYYYPTQPQHPRHQIIRNSTPPNNIRSFSTDTPSPSRSPDSHSPAQGIYNGMFNQGHQQGQHGRVNGGGRGIPPMMYNNYQHQSAQHPQHHGNIQQDHNAHSTNGSVISHHATYSGGLTSSTPSFTPQSLQNGHTANSRGGQPQHITEHWAEQLKLHKESLVANSAMVDGHAPHHYARIKAGENRGISSTAPNPTTTAQEGETEDRGRPSNLDGSFIRRQDWNNMDLSGLGLRVLGVPLFNYIFLTELYVASNKITQLPSAIGLLRSLRYLDASHNLLQELPEELGMCVYLKHLLLFNNRIKEIPNELGSLHQLEMLGIEGNHDFDQDQKLEIMERGTKALIHSLREGAPVPLPPFPPRAILDITDGAPISASQDRLKVFSYNVLCEKAATPQQYGYTPSGALSWDHRKEQILQEITAQDADIVCLQEVDNENFKEFFSMKLAYADYKGVYWPRPRSKTMSEKDAKTVDGCATFYKGSKYILLHKELIDIANIAINRPDMKNQADIFNRVMPRDHIAVITFFENRLTGARFIVVNSHLFWDPQFADVKLIQIAIVMDQISKWAEKYARWPACKDKDKKIYAIADETNSETPAEPPPEPAPSMEYTSATQIPLLLCCDINSMADSSVYELLSTGRVSPEHKDIRNFEYGNFTRDGFEHPFSLKSAYSQLDGTADALTFTNYTPGFQGIVDYIWYSTNTLEVVSLLGDVSANYMSKVPGFPNYHFPSDHLSLLAEFSIKGRKEKKTHPEPDFGPSSSNRNGRGRMDRDN